MTTATVALMRHGGSHLIRPIVAEMGFDIVEPGKTGPIDKAVGPVVVFLREPRNRMVATLRWRYQKPKYVKSLSLVGTEKDDHMAYLLGEYGFLAEMLVWARIWCAWPNAITVRFEDFADKGVFEIGRIARHLGVKDDAKRNAELYALYYGHARTYTGAHSVWREWFGPKSEVVWERGGGPELLTLMGYGNDRTFETEP